MGFAYRRGERADLDAVPRHRLAGLSPGRDQLSSPRSEVKRPGARSPINAVPAGFELSGVEQLIFTRDSPCKIRARRLGGRLHLGQDPREVVGRLPIWNHAHVHSRDVDCPGRPVRGARPEGDPARALAVEYQKPALILRPMRLLLPARAKHLGIHDLVGMDACDDSRVLAFIANSSRPQPHHSVQDTSYDAIDIGPLITPISIPSREEFRLLTFVRDADQPGLRDPGPGRVQAAERL